MQTFDGDALDLLWLADYVPELITAERQRFPAIRHIREVLGGTSMVTPVPVPADCVDGFTEAYFARLRADLDSGAWDRRYGLLRTRPEFTVAPAHHCPARLINPEDC